MRKLLICAAGLALCFASQAQTNYTLSQILDSARVNNITLGNARLDVEAARQQRLEAFTNFFPSISAAGMHFNANKGMMQTDINLADGISPEIAAVLAHILPPEALASLSNPISIEMLKNGTVGAVTAVQPVFAGGRIVNGNKLARVGEEAGRLKLKLAENKVDETAEQYFWQLASLLEKEKTVETVESLLGDISKDVNVAVDAGIAMRNDLLQVQLRQNDIASQKLKVNNGIRLVKMLLAQYCGLPDEDFSISYDSSEDITLVERSDGDAAVAGTVEYKLLGKQLEAARLQHRMEVGKYLPTIAVGAGYNYHNLLDKDHHFGMVFATVTIPISDWWGGSHAIKRKKIAVQQAQNQLNDNSALLRIKIQSAWNDVEEASEQLVIARRGIEQAAENLRLNRDFYNAGTSRMTDLLEAQMLYQQALDKQTDAFAAYHNKLAAYRHAIGQ